MSPPVRTTLVFGMISALAIGPAASLLAGYLGWPTAFKLVLWVDLVVYAGFIVRWSGRRRLSIAFPVGLLLGTACWPGVYNGFFILGLAVLAWIRSGIGFPGTPLRAALAEALTVGGGAGLTAALNPGSMVTWMLAIWLFFLIQCLYFFIVPTARESSRAGTTVDPFERACREVRRILEG